MPAAARKTPSPPPDASALLTAGLARCRTDLQAITDALASKRERLAQIVPALGAAALGARRGDAEAERRRDALRAESAALTAEVQELAGEREAAEQELQRLVDQRALLEQEQARAEVRDRTGRVLAAAVKCQCAMNALSAAFDVLWSETTPLTTPRLQQLHQKDLLGTISFRPVLGGGFAVGSPAFARLLQLPFDAARPVDAVVREMMSAWLTAEKE